MLSRIIYGSRISLTIGLVGVTLSFVFGLVIGVVSGYYGGWIDNLIQRGIEILRSFPSIPLWMALAAALPSSWSPLQIYMGITVVLSFIGWTGLARQVRGKILSLREEDFATAALLAGASRWRIMTRHLLPSFMSHIIVSLTLAVPGMILGRDVAEFSRSWAASSGDELGRAVERGAKCSGGGFSAVAFDACDFCNYYCARI